MFDRALQTDPNNIDGWRLRAIAELRQETDGEIRKLTDKLAAQPRSGEILRQLIKLHDDVAETNKVKPLVERALRDFAGDADMMRFLIAHFDRVNQLDQSLEPALRLTELESSNVTNHLLLVRAYFAKNDKPGFYQAAEKAIAVNGPEARETLRNFPGFTAWRNDPEFKKLIDPPALSPSMQAPTN